MSSPFRCPPNKALTLPPILFEILCLLKNFLIHLIPIHGRITRFSKQNYKVSLEFCLDVYALAPVGVSRFVINNFLHLPGQLNKFILRILELILVGKCLQDVVESLLLKIDTEVGE